MKILKLLLLFILIIYSIDGVAAQKAKLKRAKQYMDNMNYKTAADIYLEILDKNDNDDAKIGIAECYRRLNNINEMEYWYGQVVLLPKAEPKAFLYYAQALQANGNCTQAKKWAEKYVKIDPLSAAAQLLLKACNEETIQNLRASGALYKVQPVNELNSDKDDFCAMPYKKDKILFVTNRDDKRGPVKRTDAWNGQAFTAVFSADVKETDPKNKVFSYGKPEKFSKTMNGKYNDGPICFDAAGSESYFSRNNMEGRSEDKIIRVKIYKANGSDKNWSNLQGVPFNSDEYSVMHPSLSEDGTKLFFSSDMPGSFGGFDLYVSYMEEGRWSPPQNLGPAVNTDGDEVFPFIHPDGTLYFASNGQIGLGGFDVFFSKESFSTYGDPTNLGFPVNTPFDDFGIVFNKEKTHGYFSSNREGGKGGDDIYSFTKLSAEVEIIVYDVATNMPIEGVELFTTCSAVKSFTTNADGKVTMEVALEKSCDVAVEKNPYKPNSVRIEAKDIKLGETYIVKIPLKMQCFFDLTGIVTEGTNNTPLSDAVVTLRSDCDGEQKTQTFTTKADGLYEFKEIPEGCEFQVEIKKAGFTGDAANLATGSCDSPTINKPIVLQCIGDTCGGKKPNIDPNPIACIDCPKPLPNNWEEKCKTVTDKKKNKYLICPENDTIYRITPKGDTIYYRKTTPIDPSKVGPKELVNIYYDFDDATIRNDAEPELNRLVAFLNVNPTAKILITSHTDARGSKFYNNRLSNRRAESVVRYLIAAGISKKRLKADGMGESVMINDCYDGQPCTEAQHQENRRTEFQVYEIGAQPDFKTRKPDKIKVNPCNGCDSTAPVEGSNNNTDNQ